VEDHPLAYASFHRDIPAGQYGAGHVDIFDHGTWEPNGDPAQGLAAGKLEFELRGSRLHGGWVLLRTQMDGDPRHWLLIKRDDTRGRDTQADDRIAAAPTGRHRRKAPL
jgi:bifunctional non-homologous end joining protein LigD